MDDQQKVGVVIAAGGSSQRMGKTDKLLALLGGKPLLARVIDACQRCHLVDQIVVVVNEKNLERCRRLVDEGVGPG